MYRLRHIKKWIFCCVVSVMGTGYLFASPVSYDDSTPAAYYVITMQKKSADGHLKPLRHKQVMLLGVWRNDGFRDAYQSQGVTNKQGDVRLYGRGGADRPTRLCVRLSTGDFCFVMAAMTEARGTLILTPRSGFYDPSNLRPKCIANYVLPQASAVGDGAVAISCQ